LIALGVPGLTFINRAIGLATGYLIGKYGDDKLSQLSIDLGKEYVKKTK